MQHKNFIDPIKLNSKWKQSKTKDQQIDQLHQQIIDQCTISEVPESSRATRKRDRERGSPEKSETKKPHKELSIILFKASFGLMALVLR